MGGIGAGAVFWLSRRTGDEALGLEQFEIGHGRGGSQDHSRIIRLSYHTPGYVELAKGAYQAWAALEEDVGERLILKTGGLDLFPADPAFSESSYATSMEAAGVPFERLSTAEIRHRWPQFQITDDVHALYQSETGIAPAAKCNAAHLRMAQAHGATLRDNAPVTTVREVADEIEVVAGGTTYRCRKLVVAAGAWSNHILAHFGLALPLTVTQEQVVYYDTLHAAEFTRDRFPVWIWMDDPCLYGFPVYGEAGPKVSQDAAGKVVTAETRSFEPDPDIQARIDGFVQRILPTAFGKPILIKTCIYTMPPDRDFVIDSLPRNPNVIVTIGAGHAFKFASLFGRILSELALDGTTTHDISPFRITRPILREENPETDFLKSS